MRDWGEIEHFIMYNMPSNPLRDHNRVLHKIDDEQVSAMIRERMNAYLRSSARCRGLSIQAVMSWINTAEGVSYTAWQMLRHNKGLEERTKTDELLLRINEGLLEWIRFRDQISGIDLYAACDWPDPLGGVRAANKKRREQYMMKEAFNWRKMYFIIGQNFGFGPDVVNEFTLYQAHMYTSDPKDIGIKEDSDGVPDNPRTRRAMGG